ncbi:hypothetical protein EKH77_02325 [Streptomyces luteoverticillatus]|uniref:Uncharacterized protein n=1 Tax=Streptomyces luteoverticillatus TaxID=66425 RepID=A0A3S9PCX9_STRLT|nr:hypothetical protein EKH77_02325 [Streptomyces luteoverticillatus]
MTDDHDSDTETNSVSGREYSADQGTHAREGGHDRRRGRCGRGTRERGRQGRDSRRGGYPDHKGPHCLGPHVRQPSLLHRAAPRSSRSM